MCRLRIHFEISDAGMAVRLIVLGIILTDRTAVFVSACKIKKFFGEKIKNPYFRIGVISIPLALILFLLYNGRYSGLGTNLISAAFSGRMIYSYDWILKLLLTILTLAIGYQGGEVTPLFSIGASLGIVLGEFFPFRRFTVRHSDTQLYLQVQRTHYLRRC